MLRPPDRHGNPRGRGYRDYCALSRQRQGYTSCPGHRSRERRLGGIGSGDLVRFTHRRHGTLTGYVALMKRQGRVAITHEGRQISVKAAAAALLARNNGYRVLAAENTS